MKHISFSSVILFALSIYFVMQNRISPGETPYWLFGCIFALLVGNILVDLVFPERIYELTKNIFLWVIVATVLGSAFFASMVVRHQTAPQYGVHDIILQQEAAIQYFIHGKNPYKETYFGTPMEKWNYSDTEVNPALYHFVMEPLYLVLPIPFYVLSNHTLGYFDAREVLWLLFAGVLIIAFYIPKENEKKRLLVTLLAFNPAMLGYTLEGRSDIFVYFFLLAGFFLLQKSKLFLAGIFFAFSFLVKQSVWPLLPLYLVYLWRVVGKEHEVVFQKLRMFAKNLSGFVVVFIGITLPFYFWNTSAFLASTVYYLSGTTPHSYPISGYGFGMVLHQAGIIANVHNYFPFQWLQLGIGLPVLVIVSWYLWEKPTVQKLQISYGIFLFVFWYFSRYFNNSHLGYLSMVFITAYFWPEASDKK